MTHDFKSISDTILPNFTELAISSQPPQPVCSLSEIPDDTHSRTSSPPSYKQPMPSTPSTSPFSLPSLEEEESVSSRPWALTIFSYIASSLVPMRPTDLYPSLWPQTQKQTGLESSSTNTLGTSAHLTFSSPLATRRRKLGLGLREF